MELLTTGDFEVVGFKLEPIKPKKINGREYKFKVVVTEDTGKWLLENHSFDFIQEKKEEKYKKESKKINKEVKVNGFGG